MMSFFEREFQQQNTIQEKMNVLDTYQMKDNTRRQLQQMVLAHLNGLTAVQLLRVYESLPTVHQSQDEALSTAIQQLFNHSHTHGDYSRELAALLECCDEEEERANRKYLGWPKQTAIRSDQFGNRNFQ